jgi:hypothetical protein
MENKNAKEEVKKPNMESYKKAAENMQQQMKEEDKEE